MSCGIYAITNNCNHKVYIGQSNNIERRVAQHFSLAEQTRYADKPLYKAFNKYGEENFSWQILEECSEESLDEREQFWIQEFHALTSEYGYNILTGGFKVTDENHPNHKVTKQDVIDIRTRYNNHERCKEVEKLYANKIGHSGFSKIWKGETWSDIMPEVYTKENKEFHRKNVGSAGSANPKAKLTEADVISIRKRKNQGERWDEIYQDYKHLITEITFMNVYCGNSWKHIVVE